MMTKNSPVICEICTEKTKLPNKKFRNSDKCTHPFCTNCVIKYIRVRLEDDNTGYIKCPALNCDHKLDPLACTPLIGPSLFSRWCDVLCEAAIMGWEMCYCPYRDCNVLIVNECGGDLMKSTCPNCRRLFCFLCKKVRHPWQWCQGHSDDESFKKLAARKRWKSCPKCSRYVEKTEGCKIVRCRCEIAFCYSCGKQVDRHFCLCEPPAMIDILLILLIILALMLIPCGMIYIMA